MNEAVIRTLLATAGVTDPKVVKFVADLMANSEDVKSEVVAKPEVVAAADHASDASYLKISATVKGKPLLAYLVLTK